jgi:hypothetical protein
MPQHGLSSIPDRLQAAVQFIAAESVSLEDAWWIIGSSAAFFSGLQHPMPNDVDLLVSARDARRLFAQWQVKPTEPAPSKLFRSLFGIHSLRTIDIEIMGDLEIFADGEWQRLEPKTRERVATEAGCLFVPARGEQISILRLFGRPKDMARADALEMIPQPSALGAKFPG